MSDAGAKVSDMRAQDPAYRPTHLLAVFDLLARNDLGDGGRRRC